MKGLAMILFHSIMKTQSGDSWEKEGRFPRCLWKEKASYKNPTSGVNKKTSSNPPKGNNPYRYTIPAPIKRHKCNEEGQPLLCLP